MTVKQIITQNRENVTFSTQCNKKQYGANMDALELIMLTYSTVINYLALIKRTHKTMPYASERFYFPFISYINIVCLRTCYLKIF